MVKAYLLNRRDLEKINFDENLFSEDRKNKIASIRKEEDVQLSKCAELALIYALKQLDENVKLPLEIKAEDSGKLFLETKVKGYENIYFNISHSRDFAVCAISDAPVGIDIETIRGDVVHPEKMLYQDELLLLTFISNPEEKKKYFFDCWTSKESYLKYVGRGFDIKPDEFMIEEDEVKSEKHKLEKGCVHIFQSAEVKNSDWKLESGYKMAVCTPEKTSDIYAEIIDVEKF